MNDYVIVYGDFNHGSIDWNTLHSGSERQELLDLLLDYFLYSISKNLQEVKMCWILFSHQLNV